MCVKNKFCPSSSLRSNCTALKGTLYSIFFDHLMSQNDANITANSGDPDQLAPLETENLSHHCLHLYQNQNMERKRKAFLIEGSESIG